MIIIIFILPLVCKKQLQGYSSCKSICLISVLFHFPGLAFSPSLFLCVCVFSCRQVCISAYLSVILWWSSSSTSLWLLLFTTQQYGITIAALLTCLDVSFDNIIFVWPFDSLDTQLTARNRLFSSLFTFISFAALHINITYYITGYTISPYPFIFLFWHLLHSKYAVHKSCVIWCAVAIPIPLFLWLLLLLHLFL